MNKLSSPTKFASLLVIVLLAAALSRCGGGSPVVPNGGAPGTISGIVSKGPVNAATVTAYSVTATGERGTALGSTTTSPSGSFTLSELPSYNGPLLLVATGSWMCGEGDGTFEALYEPVGNVGRDASVMSRFSHHGRRRLLPVGNPVPRGPA